MLQDLHVLEIPTKTDFRGIRKRELVIFQGPNGWSEFSPFIEYSDAEAKVWLQAALESAFKKSPDLKRNKIEINATLPRVEVSQVVQILNLYPGAKVIKIKIDSFESDRALIESALAFNPSAKIRLDINGGWSLDQAKREVPKFVEKFGTYIEYFEQPCNRLEELKELKQQFGIKIALDESIRKNLNSDFNEMADYGDFAIIKWQPSGGWSAATKLIEKIKLPVIISSALESGIGISRGLELAGILGIARACGLGTVGLLGADIVNEPLEIINGEIAISPRTPNMKAIEIFKASEERRAWWMARIDRIIKSGGFDEYLN